MHSNTAAHTEGNQSSHFLSHCLGFQGKRYVSVVSPFLSNTCSDWTLSVCFWRKRRLAHMLYKDNCKHDTVEWITVTLTSGHLDFCQNVFKKGHIFPPSQFSQAGVSWSDLSKLWKKKNDACSNRLLVFANSLSCEKKKRLNIIHYVKLSCLFESEIHNESYTCLHTSICKNGHMEAIQTPYIISAKQAAPVCKSLPVCYKFWLNSTTKTLQLVWEMLTMLRLIEMLK